MENNTIYLRQGLYRSLVLRSGLIQKDISPPVILDAAWNNGIHFKVSYSERCRFGWYNVERNGQCLSEKRRFNKVDERLYLHMQRMIDEIEAGKYKHKKTLSEKIAETVQGRNLTSYMNNTKWRELLYSLEEQIPEINIQYKTLFEDKGPDCFWGLCGDEYICHMNYAAIEWMKISQFITDEKRIGRLIAPGIIRFDQKQQLIDIFERYNIPFDYDAEDKYFTVYGYK